MTAVPRASASSRRHRFTRRLAIVCAPLLLLGLIGIPSGVSALDVTSADSSPSAEWWNPPNRPAVDSEINATGAPFTGTDAEGKVRGWIDSHAHVNSNDGFGGRLICGAPFAPGGITEALKDCPDHYPNGNLALFENLTSDDDWTHDPVGWPTFKDWPKTTSMSHQAGYYAWIERSWRSGQRVLVNDLVTNGVICSLPVLPKDRGCDEMDAIRRQAQLSYDMQDYIDNIYGGPGKGFYRIVRTPEEAADVIESGRLAVVLGVETSEPFGCRQILGLPQCSKADIDRGLDELQGLGVSSMFLCHKFDNALCGVRFDTGTQGTIINVGQFLSTGTFWTTEKCTTAMSDNPIGNADAGVIEDELPPGVEVPTYDNKNKCNVKGMTALGEYALQGMIKRKMMVELDHMSVKSANRALDVLESAGYPGVLSSHSWSDQKFTERIYRLGGFRTGYPGEPDSFLGEWRSQAALRAKYDKAYGFGLDYNGIGSHPGPQGADSPNKVTYPYTAIDGSTVMNRQVTGERTWDLNTDGAAHYGLVPDMIEQLDIAGGGQELVDDLMAGSQSYLDTWTATRAYTKPVNMATGRMAQASSQEWTLFNRLQAKYATDGNLDSRWASGNWGVDPQWIRVDLGATQTVGRVTIDWESAYAKGYSIQVSADANTWKTVSTVTAGDGGSDNVVFDATQARWVRVLNTARGTKHGYSIRELGVYAR